MCKALLDPEHWDGAGALSALDQGWRLRGAAEEARRNESGGGGGGGGGDTLNSNTSTLNTNNALGTLDTNSTRTLDGEHMSRSEFLDTLFEAHRSSRSNETRPSGDAGASGSCRFTPKSNG